MVRILRYSSSKTDTELEHDPLLKETSTRHPLKGSRWVMFVFHKSTDFCNEKVTKKEDSPLLRMVQGYWKPGNWCLLYDSCSSTFVQWLSDLPVSFPSHSLERQDHPVVDRVEAPIHSCNPGILLNLASHPRWVVKFSLKVGTSGAAEQATETIIRNCGDSWDWRGPKKDSLSG